MRLQFIDKNNSVLDLNTISNFNYTYDFPALELRNSIVERLSIDGGYETGDHTYKSRKFPISFTLTAKTDLEFRKIINNIVVFFASNKRPFVMRDTDNPSLLSNMEAKIIFGGIKPKFKEGLELRVCQGEIDIEIISPFFEYPAAVVANTFSNNEIFNINIDDVVNNIKAYNAYPIMTITTASLNNDFSITNNTNNLSMRLQENNFTPSDTIEVDCYNGQIKLNNQIKNRIMTSGSFIKFESGSNAILYQGTPDITISFSYRSRFIL
ncbi:MAG: phage tail family protein [Leptospiraceae bacterium]|nr:phage tail family protein [Leptospiraceae bacterium]